MNNRPIRKFEKLLAALGAGILLLPSAVLAAEDDYEVLTRGPVHEAFAEAVNFQPEPGLIVTTEPPAAIEELPPDQRPEGDDVTWISGYWAWDDEQADFLWISGVWRNVPPDRQWVPGYWNDLGDSRWQWTSGYWADADAAEANYISTPPPASLEQGPNIAAPSEDHTWMPGVWHWMDTRYVWRPGCWSMLRPNWTWVPSRYCWTPRGYLYLDGYWDYEVARRGMLFAPVHFRHHVWSSPGYYYTPSIVVGVDAFLDHLFFRPRSCHYYFGDYYGSRYRDAGFRAAFSWHSGRGGYEPIFAYQCWQNRNDRGWLGAHQNRHQFRLDHADARPPHTWAAMQQVRTDARDVAGGRMFASPLAKLTGNPGGAGQLLRLDKEQRDRIGNQGRPLHTASLERRRIEAVAPARAEAGKELVTRQQVPSSPVVGRRSDKLPGAARPPERLDSGRLAGRRTTGAGPGVASEGGPGVASEGGPGVAGPGLGRTTQPKVLQPKTSGRTDPAGRSKLLTDAQPTQMPELRKPAEREVPKQMPELRKTPATQPQLSEVPKQLPGIRKPAERAVPKQMPEIRRTPATQPQVREVPKQMPEIRRTPAPQPQVRQAPKQMSEVRRAPAPQPQVRQAPRPMPEVRRAPAPQPQVRQAPRPMPEVRRAPAPQPQVREAPKETTELEGKGKGRGRR